MLKVHSRAAAVAAALFVFALAPGGLRDAAAAAQFSIEPLLLRLPADKLATSLTLGNAGAQPVIVHTELLTWTQDGGEDAYGEAPGMVVSPPIFSLAPGAKQIVRVGRVKRGAAPAREQAFRIRLSEVPPKASDTRTVATTLQVSLPIFVPPADRDAKPTLALRGARQDGSGLRITLANGGLVHDKVIGVRLVQDGKPFADKSMNYYVLAGAQRVLVWPAAIPEGRSGPVQLEVQLHGRNRVLTQPLTLQAVAPAPAPPTDAPPAPPPPAPEPSGTD